MSAFVEQVDQIFHHSDEEIDVILQNGEVTDWKGSKKFKRKEWMSPDGRKKITVSLCGGPEYAGTYMRDVHLYALVGEVSFAKLMGVKAITRIDSPVINYNVYLDAMAKYSEVMILDEGEQDGWCLANIAYRTADNGLMTPVSALLFPDQAYLSGMRTKGFYTLNEMPGDIDVEATVVSFMNQIEESDFSGAVLIEK
jgi:hypothetical protein